MVLDIKTPEFQRAWAKIVARSWADAEFRSRLIAEPAAVLREHGVDVPKGTRLRIDEEPLSSLFTAITPGPSPKMLRMVAGAETAAQPEDECWPSVCNVGVPMSYEGRAADAAPVVVTVSTGDGTRLRIEVSKE